MTKYLPFYLDGEEFVSNDKSFIITGSNLGFLTAFLNSPLFKYCFIDHFPELQGGTRELRKVFFETVTVLKVDEPTEKHFENLVKKRQAAADDSSRQELDELIASEIFNCYKLTEDERREVAEKVKSLGI